jgi:polysaccharide biosynthesis protein PelC
MEIGRSTGVSSGRRMTWLGALCLLAGCASSAAMSATAVKRGAQLSARRWVLLPLMNYSEAPHADEGARAILSTLLRARGIRSLAEAPATTRADDPMPDLDGKRRLESAIAWSKKEKQSVALTGSVNEWRYRGADGVPAVGLSLSLLDVESGEVLWTASGARSGSAGDTVSGTAQRLMEELLRGLEIE